ncbi:Protein of unknown function [Pyronema omphalodes CBS 100304]|uniref:Uncharacterized protein n=1 Tax=Pyronema omphalodes (strain CBS 100304) TaxID=1076935 RepID=U4LBK0_PYROM|nr:Protein of unknown function [Pyronema omphalodes CBS 100304]
MGQLIVILQIIAVRNYKRLQASPSFFYTVLRAPQQVCMVQPSQIESFNRRVIPFRRHVSQFCHSGVRPCRSLKLHRGSIQVPSSRCRRYFHTAKPRPAFGSLIRPALYVSHVSLKESFNISEPHG